MKIQLVALLLLTPILAMAQADSGWGAPDNSAAWGGRTDDLNPIAPQNVHKLDKEQANPLNDSVLPKTKVVSPYDDSGVYIGESQALTGEGIDPSTGVTVTDTPRQ